MGIPISSLAPARLEGQGTKRLEEGEKSRPVCHYWVTLTRHLLIRVAKDSEELG